MRFKSLMKPVAMVCIIAALSFAMARADTVKARKFDPAKISVNDLVRDTQRMGEDPSKLLLVWWVPPEFWQVALAKNPDMSEKQITDMVKTMSKYTVVAVVSGDMENPGQVDYQTEAQVRDVVSIKDSSGNSYTPLANDDIDPDTQSMMASMKPIFSGMLGPMGKHFYFLLFPPADKAGKPIAQATGQGKFTVMVDKLAFNYRLPLPSMVPAKQCPMCHEKLQGAYKFCPYDGTKLPDED